MNDLLITLGPHKVGYVRQLDKGKLRVGAGTAHRGDGEPLLCFDLYVYPKGMHLEQPHFRGVALKLMLIDATKFPDPTLGILISRRIWSRFLPVQCSHMAHPHASFWTQECDESIFVGKNIAKCPRWGFELRWPTLVFDDIRSPKPAKAIGICVDSRKRKIGLVETDDLICALNRDWLHESTFGDVVVDDTKKVSCFFPKSRS